MWRWLVPVGLASAAAIQMIFLGGVRVGDYGYTPGAITGTWLWLMITAIPTMLLYRLLIAAGERILPWRPWLGAAVLVLAAAVLPPFLHNRWTAAENAGQDFAGPLPARVETIAIEERGTPREALELGVAPCGDACLRLLFGGGAQRVVVGDPDATAATARRGRQYPGEPASYAPAPVLHLERRPVCPPVLTAAPRDYAPYTQMVRIGPALRRENELDMAARSLALIAAGHCPIITPGRFTDAQLLLGTRSDRDQRNRPQPGGAGLIGYDYRFIDRRDGAGWTRVGQHVDVAHVRHWTYPFAILKARFGWVATIWRTTVSDRSGADDSAQPWAGLGFTLPEVPETDWRNVRDMLTAALALPQAAPRDARLQLGPQYLARLARRSAEPADEALVPRLVADPRIPVDDLWRVTDIDARLAAPALFARIRSPGTRGGDLRTLVHIAHEVRGGNRRALLSLLGELSTDPSRRQEISGQLAQYEEEERRRATPPTGSAAPADYGATDLERPHPVAIAIDIALLALIHLALLLLAARRWLQRVRKGLQERQSPAS